MSCLDLERLFIDRIDIFRLKETADKYGGTQKDPVKIAEDVPARLQDHTGIRTVEVDGRTVNPTRTADLPIDVEIKPGDSIRRGDESYKVLFVTRHRDIDTYVFKTIDLIEQDYDIWLKSSD